MRPYAYFVTLTYSDEFLPIFHYSQKAELYKPDLIKFIDKIRQVLPKITIFAVGEYGGYLFGTKEAERPIHPHYHLAIFSNDPNINSKIRKACTDKWSFGHSHILQLSGGLIDYITGYVSKKLTNYDSMEKIMQMRIRPEFSYSSRRPAIGDVSEELVSITEQHGELEKLIIDGKTVTIPKYLKFKVKDKLLYWDLDFNNPNDCIEYERRKDLAKIETMQKLYEKKEEEKTIILARKIKRSDIKKQLIANFESRIQRSTKGKKVL